ncbi:MAG: succinyldiaminopimelate transaminase [Nocardioidaceae bacterium]
MMSAPADPSTAPSSPTGWAAPSSGGPVSARLPEFPWDSLAEAKALASAHPDGIVDLSIGTPVDDTPRVAQDALARAANAPGYPATVGRPEVRQAAVDWLARRFGVTGLDIEGVLPTIGSKELIAGLPTQLGLGPHDTVVVPRLAYPTYEVGARLAGCEVLAGDSTLGLGPRTPTLVWLNSPSNPTGKILPVAHLRKMVDWARERGVLLVSDECYLEYAWDAEPVSILHPDVCAGSHEGLLSIHSLSKRSNLAGYRAGLVAGDPAVVAELLAVRKNLGLIVPQPVQDVVQATLADDAHVEDQRGRYSVRRARLREAFERAGFGIDDSEGSLYLWATRREPCRQTVRWLAGRGILVAPGDFYGAAGAQHVRIAFTASDGRVDAACERL